MKFPEAIQAFIDGKKIKRKNYAYVSLKDMYNASFNKDHVLAEDWEILEDENSELQRVDIVIIKDKLKIIFDRLDILEKKLIY